MPDIYLYAGEPNLNDIRLRDPTVLVGGGVDGTASPAVLASLSTIPVASLAGSSNYTASVQSLVIAVQSHVLSGSAMTSPSVLAASFAVQSPVATADSITVATVQSATLSIQSASASGTADGTAFPEVVSALFCVMAIDVSGSEPLQSRRTSSASSGSGRSPVYWYPPIRTKRSRRRDDEESMLVGGAM